MEVTERTSVVWVILDAEATVVLICSGADATEVVEEWVARGYQAVCLGADEVTAA